ncbi:MAG: rhomboid family intramembrane serine protease [Burkholderiales bacterium]|nr:rhomboid family intramembrane serine protease [Burkholderiales bacterium]
MLLPIGDYPNPSGRHWMTLALIGANVTVYLLVTLPLSAQPVHPADPRVAEYLHALARHLPPGVSPSEILRGLTEYDLFAFRWGFRPAAMSATDLFTSMFLHGSLMHLVGNMLYLWIYGNNVEDRLGPAGFLLAYLATGVAATAFQTLFNPTSPVPMIGASGAISGVLGFYLRWFPHHYVKLFVFLFPFYVGTTLLPASLVLWAYLVLDNLVPLFFGGPAGIAHGAHIGGFIAGFAAAVALGRRPARDESDFG